jgi:hypothetical protein
MTNGGFGKVTAKTAAEVCKQFALSEEAEPLLRGEQTPRQFLDLLLQKERHLDAIRFLAYAMPRRETVWWACLCGRRACGTNLSPKAAAAFQAAEKWVSDPNDTNRWAAKAAGDAIGNEHPAGLAALAVFWAGGSITPAGQHPVPAPEHMTGLMAGGAVMLAAVFNEQPDPPEWYKQFFALGFEVASGKNVWK